MQQSSGGGHGGHAVHYDHGGHGGYSGGHGGGYSGGHGGATKIIKVSSHHKKALPISYVLEYFFNMDFSSRL